MTSVSAPVLLCGTELGQLVDQVADRLLPEDTLHQRGCPHCRQALETLDPLWAGLRTLAAEPVRVPARVIDEVMARVRAGRSRWEIVLDASRGVTLVGENVVALVARCAAHEVPGVAVVESATAHASHERGQGASGAFEVAITVTLRGLRPVTAVAEAVREQVSALVAGMTGLAVARVDVTVSDLDLSSD